MTAGTRWTVTLGLALGLALAACEEDSDGEATSPQQNQEDEQAPEKVEKAAAIARAIEADPGGAEQALAEHDMSIDEFERLMYEIAGDPELSGAYETALD